MGTGHCAGRATSPSHPLTKAHTVNFDLAPLNWLALSLLAFAGAIALVGVIHPRWRQRRNAYFTPVVLVALIVILGGSGVWLWSDGLTGPGVVGVVAAGWMTLEGIWAVVRARYLDD